MNKLWFVLTAGLLLVVVFLASRLIEAERKLALLEAEARSLSTRVRIAPASPTGKVSVPESFTTRASKVARRIEASESSASAPDDPLLLSSRFTLRGGKKKVPKALHEENPVLSYASAEMVSGLTVGDEPGTGTGWIEHWQGGSKRNWGHEQAAGEPDTTQPGDIQTAWASKQPDGGEEWIQLDYDRAVDLKQISVVESHNPGAISKVVAMLPDGSETPIWEGTMDPSAENELVSSDFQVGGNVRAQSVKVYLDTARVPGWNEIHAVQIIGRDGSKQWATASRASSSYPDR